MRKLWKLMLSLTVLLCISIGVKIDACAEAGTYEGFEYSYVEGEGGIITKYAGNAVNLEIPSRIDGVRIVKIGNGAFWGCTSLESVRIPESIWRIADGAFVNCRNLTQVNIPKSVGSIGERVFEGCDSLEGIYVDTENENLCSLDGVLFSKSMYTLICFPAAHANTVYCIPENVGSIDTCAFCGAKNLNAVEIPESVTEINFGAFWDCSSLKQIKIPKNVEYIATTPFEGCDSLTKIEVDEENDVYCSLEGVLFNKEMTELIYCPSGYPNISYCIPSQVKKIRNYAFERCNRLMHVKIPENVTVIGDEVFEECSSLTTVEIEEGLSEIKYGTFKGCSSLNNINIPESVTSIGAEVFEGCESLIALKIPENVNEIRASAFNNCKNLRSMMIMGNIDNIIIYKDYDTGICEFLFEGCDSLENVYLYGKIPLECHFLAYVKGSGYEYAEEKTNTLPDISTLNVHILEKNWDSYAQEKERYKNINWVKWDGKTEHVWNDGVITKVATATEDGVMTYICAICGEIRTEVIPATGGAGNDGHQDNTNNIGTSPSPGVTSPRSLSIGDSIQDTATSAVYQVTGTGTVEYTKPLNAASKTVTIPKEVTLEGVTYKVASVASGAFKGNKKLAKVTIGANATTIGTNAFSGCTKLKNVTIGKNVASIGAKAFYKCTSLTKITIPVKVTTIGKQAFSGCMRLKNITIKANKLTTKTVGVKAFKGINAKAVIKVPRAKVKTYKKLLKAKGLGAKAKIK